MQNPEVWSFNEPQPSFRICKQSKTDITNKLYSSDLSHLVSVVLPGTSRLPDDLVKTLSEDSQYYKVLNLKLSELLDSTFIESFIKKGNLFLLSIGTRIDCDNCCAIIPSADLVLSLTKDTYQNFGLEGKLSHFTQRNKDRYIVKINLAKLVPGKPLYEKTKTALDSLERFTVLLAWEPPVDRVCPSSVAKYLHDNGYQIKLCEPTFNTRSCYSVETPTLDGMDMEDNDITDFIEWLGMISLEADLLEDTTNYISNYQTPGPCTEVERIRVVTWRGFFLPNQIKKLVEFLKDYDLQQMWCSLYVQGFSDNPLIDFKEEQNYFTSGDNSNIYIFKNNFCWCCKLRCCAKKYK